MIEATTDFKGWGENQRIIKLHGKT